MLSGKARQLIEDAQNIKYVSMVSFYEMSIKLKLGKLSLKPSLKHYFEKAITYGIIVLPLSENHLFQYDYLPLVADHRDPFDRLIIAAAMFEKLDIISVDEKFSHYNKLVNIIW